MNSIKNFVTHNLMNAIGWRSKRKFLIIESDDWGSLRMTSKDAFYKLKKAGLNVENDPYNRLDALERTDDFTNLYEVLDKHRDRNGNPACMTTNTIMSNPDFNRIKEDNFQHYYSIGLEESYHLYSDGQSAISTLTEGINNKFIFPQFHGKEHLNVPLWMKALQSRDETTLAGFEEHVFGLKTKAKMGSKQNYMAAFEACSINNSESIRKALVDGLDMFKSYFRFKSKTLIAPCYIWDKMIERVSADAGVEGIQGISYQYVPAGNSLKKRLHYTGQINKYGQNYLVRNAFFEPSLEPDKDVVNECISRINTAFRWGKPAIVGSHRLNFIGSLEKENRENSLKLLDQLLAEIRKQWPEVEFISSDQLISIMKCNRQ